jgi:hypothetical protein
MALHIDISWREQYVSHALNRKFTGIIPTGVYRGFNPTVNAAGLVTVGEDGEEGIAVAETNGYSVTIRQEPGEPEAVQASSETPYIVLVPYYAIGVATRVSLSAVASPAPHHIILARAEKPGGAAWTLNDSERQVATWHGSNTTALAQMAAAQVETMEQQIALHQRVYALEQAAEQV